MITELIRKSGGRFFKVSFIKRTTGERREMVARLHVKKGITGEGLKFDPAERNLMTVYDVQKRGYRMISLNSLISFKCGKLEWRAA